jgi:hypothetical protein
MVSSWLGNQIHRLSLTVTTATLPEEEVLQCLL